MRPATDHNVARPTWTFKEAKRLAEEDPYSCLEIVRCTRHTPLLPLYIGSLDAGVKDMMKSELTLYSHSLGGVMLAFSRLSCLQPYGTLIGSEPYVHIDIQGDFVVFKAKIGSILKGVINKCDEDFIGCLVHGCFNASIPKYMRDIGIPQDLSIGQEFLFRVTRIETKMSVLSIRGVLFEESFSVSTPVITPTEKETNQSSQDVPVEDSSEMLEVVRKKKKKSRHRQPEETSENETTSESAPVDELNNEEDSPIETVKKKKKKKKHKSEDPDEEVPVNNTDIQDDSQVDNENSSEPVKKKKKKKHKK